VKVRPPFGIGKLGDDWYGFEYTLNLGSQGSKAETSGFVARLLISWTPGSAALNAEVGLKLPGVSGSNDLFTIEGVLRVAADFYEMKVYTSPSTGYMLLMKSMALRLLGIKIRPARPRTSICSATRPRHRRRKRLGWLRRRSRRDRGERPFWCHEECCERHWLMTFVAG